MKKLLLALTLFLCTNVSAKYREYRISEIPQNVSSLYLRDALRYLSLATKTEAIINATYSGYTGVSVKLLTFQKEGIRVMIIKDKTTNIQSINIIALHNGEDIYHAASKPMHQGGLFMFPVNEFYLNKYAEIREVIIRNIQKGVVKINTLGSASPYGTLLAIELSSMQIPVDTVVMFGAVRFTTQDMHNKIAKTFSTRMIALTHENEMNYLTQLKGGYADTLPNEYMICEKPKCSGKIYELKHFSLNDLLRHFSEVPQQHATVYHDSLLKYNEAYSN
ncbi:MAG: hypothetical protein O3A66_02395 [Proteobacteria bacterium]|jgi:hypothetical protein|nr:hypothetical protein [Pseudomonadota bacterium]